MNFKWKLIGVSSYEFNIFEDIFKMCRCVSQNRIYHPEVNLYTHSLQCFHYAVRDSLDISLCLAALFHDVGKVVEKMKKEQGGHEDYSINLLKLTSVWDNKITWLIKNHMRVGNYIKGEMKRYKKTKELVENEWFVDLIKLYRYDHMARVKGFYPNIKLSDIFEVGGRESS